MGAGVFPPEASRRQEADFIPAGVDWIRDRVTEILPDQKTVATASGRRLAYDWLVVALGIQIDWRAIPGLAAGIGTRVLREGVQSPLTVTPLQDSRKRKVFVERRPVQTKWRDFDKAHILLSSGLQPRVALRGKTHLVAAGESHKDHSSLMPCLQGTVSQGARPISV